MHLLFAVLFLMFVAWLVGPKAFNWCILGPLVGIPLGLFCWAFLQLWFPALLSVRGCASCAGAGWLISGAFFRRFL